MQLPGAEKYLNEEGRADKPISIDDDDDEEAGGQEQQVRAGRGRGTGREEAMKRRWSRC